MKMSVKRIGIMNCPVIIMCIALMLTVAACSNVETQETTEDESIQETEVEETVLSETSMIQEEALYSEGLDYHFLNDEVATVSGIGTCTDLDIRVPPVVEGRTVTKIGDGAFEGTNITSIEMPDGVEYVGELAFKDCSSLEYVVMPDSVSYIGTAAFSGCNSLTSISIPSGVSELPAGLFLACTNLESVTIPESVTVIGATVFGSCSSLSDVIIPDSVTSIGNLAFNGCNSLTSIVVPDSVTSIHTGVFSNCDNLTTVVLPEEFSVNPGLSSTDGYTIFENNSSLETINGVPAQEWLSSHGAPNTTENNGSDTEEYLIYINGTQVNALTAERNFFIPNGSTVYHWCEDQGSNYCIEEVSSPLDLVYVTATPQRMSELGYTPCPICCPELCD